MGAPIPPLRLTGSHTCDRCGSIHGPHFRGYWGTLCFDCETDRVIQGNDFRSFVMLSGVVVMIAAIALTVATQF